MAPNVNHLLNVVSAGCFLLGVSGYQWQFETSQSIIWVIWVRTRIAGHIKITGSMMAGDSWT